MNDTNTRYSTIAIWLHWTIFALIAANVVVGGWAEDAEGAEKASYFATHMSIGITVLLLSLVRLAWRLGHRWPALPAAMPAWERVLARTTHVVFYVLMIGIPLLGWAAVSAFGGQVGPLFGVIPWPNLPIGEGRALGSALGGAHGLMVKALYVVLALHVAGALKHQFVDRDHVLARMLPFLRRGA